MLSWRLLTKVMLAVVLALGVVLGSTAVSTSTAEAAADLQCYYYSEEVGHICGQAAPPPSFQQAAPPDGSFLNLARYGRLGDHVNLYNAPNGTPVRNLGKGYLWAAVTGWEDVGGQRWYQVTMVDRGIYVRAEDIKLFPMTEFQGVQVLRQPDHPFGWIVGRGDIIPSREPGEEPDTAFAPLKRYDFFEVYEAVVGEDDWIWYYIGGGRWIRQTEVSLIDLKQRPEEIGADEFWTEVDLYEQTLAAYEGDRMVYATLISSGLNRWPTREGLFQVFDRHARNKMSGAEGQIDYYYVADVPHTLYFDELMEIALHGAYWHDRFGFKHSHGCVNMPPRDSEWVFNWSLSAPNDLWVWVHTSDPNHYFDRYIPEERD